MHGIDEPTHRCGWRFSGKRNQEQERNHRCPTNGKPHCIHSLSDTSHIVESVKCRQQHQFVACVIFCETDVFWHSFFSAVCFERNTADVCVRISVRKRNCETFWPSQTVMNSGGNLRARRCWWHLRRRQKCGGTRAFSWSTSGEFILSTSFWGVLRGGLGVQDSRSCVKGFIKGASGFMEDWQRSDREPGHTVFSLKLGHSSRPRNKKTNCRMSRMKRHNCKQHAATKESTRCWPSTKIISRWLLIARPKSGTTLLLFFRALEGKTVEGNLCLTQLSLMPARDSETHDTRSMRKSEAKAHESHCRNKVRVTFSLWPGT